MAWLGRARQASRQLILFVMAAFSLGLAFSVVDSTFNNFLNEKFALTGFQRSFLEFPRELPGFLVVFVSALLWFLCSRRLGAVSMLLTAGGAVLIGFASSSYGVMVIWLFVYSLGQHLFMPLSAAIGMELAAEGKAGQRLGQLNAIRNLAAILGSFLVVLGFKFLGFTFQRTFAIAAGALAAAALLLFAMSPDRTRPPGMFLKLHKEYRLYYILGSISGARRQLFLTFAPWVLVKVFSQPTQIMATLYTIGGVIGILFQPLLGRAIDRLGERIVLASEAVILVFVCFGYGFAKFLLPPGTAFLVVCACFLVDQMVFSVSMARSTYIKKIAMQPDHVQPALTAAVTIDHIFSIAAAILGGLIWNAFGFQYVFLMGVFIALINLAAALQVRVPEAGVKPQGWRWRQTMDDQSKRNDPAAGGDSQARYPEGYWDAGDEYLRDCYLLQHNDDYLEFLVTRVWGLKQPCRLVEFGCGAGKMGMKLLPLLAPGSTYTGVDQSSALLEKGRQIWGRGPFRGEFYQGTIYAAPFADNTFDLAMTHTVLMHVPRPEQALREMIRVTRTGGRVITCEANRNAHTAMLHIEETDHQETVPLALFQTLNREIRKRTGVDHNIGIKMPVLMHKAGLVDVQARKSDAVRCLFPPLDTEYKHRLFKAICDEGYGQPKPDEAQRARWKANLMGYGISAEAAEEEIDRELEEDFLNKGPQYHTVYPTLLTWSFGTVKK